MSTKLRIKSFVVTATRKLIFPRYPLLHDGRTVIVQYAIFVRTKRRKEITMRLSIGVEIIKLLTSAISNNILILIIIKAFFQLIKYY